MTSTARFYLYSPGKSLPRFSPVSILLTAALLLPGFQSSAVAQEPVVQTGAPDPDSIAGLRVRIEQQSRQLEALTREVIRLSRILEQGTGVATSPAPDTGTPQAVVRAPGSRPTAAETNSVPPTPPAAPAQGEHVVAKGETLTAIAKKYGVTVDELQAFNGIKDGRLLQIDQVLKIPQSGDVPPASPTPSKEAISPIQEPGVTP